MVDSQVCGIELDLSGKGVSHKVFVPTYKQLHTDHSILLIQRSRVSHLVSRLVWRVWSGNRRRRLELFHLVLHDLLPDYDRLLDVHDESLMSSQCHAWYGRQTH